MATYLLKRRHDYKYNAKECEKKNILNNKESFNLMKGKEKVCFSRIQRVP